MLMELNYTTGQSNNLEQRSLKSSLNLNLYPMNTQSCFDSKEDSPCSSSSLLDNYQTDSFGNKTCYNYNELTPSSSPGSPHFYPLQQQHHQQTDNSTTSLKRSSSTEIVKTPTYSDCPGDVDDDEFSSDNLDERMTRPNQSKLYQRYKKSNHPKRNSKSRTSYLRYKSDSRHCSDSDDSNAESNLNSRIKSRKAYQHIRRKRRQNRRVKTTDEAKSQILLHHDNKTMVSSKDFSFANDEQENEIKTGTCETEARRPFINNVVLFPGFKSESKETNNFNNEHENLTINEDKRNSNTNEGINKTEMSPIVKQEYISRQQQDFHETLERGNGLELIKLLKETGSTVNINLVDPEGQTALHKSIMNGNFEQVKILLSYGANSRLTNRDGWTALHMAAHAGHANILYYLFSNMR